MNSQALSSLISHWAAVERRAQDNLLVANYAAGLDPIGSVNLQGELMAHDVAVVTLSALPYAPVYLHETALGVAFSTFIAVAQVGTIAVQVTPSNWAGSHVRCGVKVSTPPTIDYVDGDDFHTGVVVQLADPPSGVARCGAAVRYASLAVARLLRTLGATGTTVPWSQQLVDRVQSFDWWNHLEPAR